MIIHLEPDILECELNWTLGSTTTKKASGGDRIPVELFQIPKRWCYENAALNMPPNLENSALTTGREHIQSQRKAMSKNSPTIALISHATKLMLKILQAMLQQYLNRELPDMQGGFRKGRGTKIKLPTSTRSLKNQDSSRRNLFLFYWDFDCVDYNKCWEILKQMGVPDHLTRLLINLYTGQEATVRTGNRTTDWLQIGKGVPQGCIIVTLLI